MKLGKDIISPNFVLSILGPSIPFVFVYYLICSLIYLQLPLFSHFGCPKITFDIISGHFRSICNSPAAILEARNSLSITFLAISDRFFHKMATEGHFGYPKITFDRISRHFRSIPNFHLFLNLFTKWPPAAMFLSPQEISLAHNLGLLRIV